MIRDRLWKKVTPFQKGVTFGVYAILYSCRIIFLIKETCPKW